MIDSDLAYVLGREDYAAGVSIYDNRYRDGTVEFRRWVDGRVQAIIDERAAVNGADMLKHESDAWVFSSGRKRYAFTERLSIDYGDDGPPQISYGSDGGFWSGFERDSDPALSKADLKELAELQIQRWQQFIEWLSHQEPVQPVSNDQAWDSQFRIAEYSPFVRFSPDSRPDDYCGISIGGGELQWPVSFEKLQIWGWKEGDECSWLVEGPSLCWFSVDCRRVAKGERSADGCCTWTPQCTCLDDEDSGGNRFKDWDEDCPLHGRRAASNGNAPP